MDEQEIDHLIARLQNHEHWQMRASAAQILARLHGEDRIYKVLVAALDDPHPEVRSVAIGGLGIPGDKRAVELLLNLLQYATEHPSEYWAYSSAWSLGRIGDERAVTPLVDALKHPVIAMRLRAATALGDLQNIEAVMPLARLLLSDDDPSLRAAIANALGRLGDSRAADALLQVLKATSDQHARGWIVMALGQIGDHRAVPDLIDVLETDSAFVACYAAEALGRLGDERAIDPLLKVLKGQKTPSSWAARALGRFADERILDALVEALLQGEDAAVRIAAAEGLMDYGDSRALPSLDSAKATDNGIDYDTGKTVKWAATRARRSLRHLKRER